MAHAQGAYETCVSALGQALPRMAETGGSHAQRDVFDRLTIDSGIRAGFFDEAEAILAERTMRRAGSQDRYAEARNALLSEGRAASACGARVPA